MIAKQRYLKGPVKQIYGLESLSLFIVQQTQLIESIEATPLTYSLLNMVETSVVIGCFNGLVTLPMYHVEKPRPFSSPPLILHGHIRGFIYEILTSLPVIYAKFMG